jgi:hypothetical protein
MNDYLNPAGCQTKKSKQIGRSYITVAGVQAIFREDSAEKL